jgi:threonine synthase
MGIVQMSGCAPMVDAFERGQRVATPNENPGTVIVTLATGNPGRAYELLYDYVAENGGRFVATSDDEAFHALRIAARYDGLSVEPATAAAFAGLFKLVHQGHIKPDDVVVLNCSGHTMPVEKKILGDQWSKLVDLSDQFTRPVLPEDGLLAVVDQMEEDIKRVVIIEDTADAARLLMRLLKSRRNCDVQIAENGVEGMKLIRRLHPDLVITDLMMPEMDGFEVINRMKSERELSQIPVVVITAKELTVKERKELEGMVDLLLPKGSALDDEFVENLVNKLDH